MNVDDAERTQLNFEETDMTGSEAALGIALAKGTAGPAANFLTTFGRKKYDAFVANYTNAFTNHLSVSLEKARLVKNILYKNQSANTIEKYVNVTFNLGEETIDDSSVVDGVLAGHRYKISGRGGAGKTMFTKWTVLKIIDSMETHQKIPLYVELRDISKTDHSGEFYEYIFNSTSTILNKATKNQFLEGLKAGIFVVILDAADEIDKSIRSDMVKKIDKFTKTFENCGIIITTREFDEVDSLAGLIEIQTSPLSQAQAIEIIQKLDYDQDVKLALIKEINTGKFEDHSFFLASPLLVTIMLLTYDQSKDIPNKKSTFYKRAFEALYERHDAAKGVYKRDHHAGLPMDEFERVFSTFCYGTYIYSTYDFSDSDLTKLFRDAVKFNGIDDDPALIAKDAVESACLLVREGHDYVFAHRSFQEYFAALFIVKYRGDDIRDIVESALVSGRGENVFELLFEMDKNLLEKEYVLPKLSKLNKELARYDMATDIGALRAFKLFFSGFTVNTQSRGMQYFRTGTSWILNFSFLMRYAYPQLSILPVLVGDKPFPLEEIKAKANPRLKNIRTLNSISSSDGDDWDVLLTDRDAGWFGLTNFAPRLKKLVKDLQGLEREIQARIDEKQNGVLNMFANFKP